jgi:MoaA/NifB/PqqE/SkfB family radical SAM enzyme
LPFNSLQKARKFARLVFKKRVSFPKEIQLEITNRCNLDCDMCPRLTLLKVPELDMSELTFKAILDNLKNPRAITLTGWGEPLMHDRFFDFIDEVHHRFPRCQLSFTTNGFLLSQKVVEKILQRPISRITLSLEELPWEQGRLDQQEARSRGLDPKKGHSNALAHNGHPSSNSVIEGIRALVAGRAKRRRKPEIRLQAVMLPSGLEPLLRLIDFALDEGLDLVNLVRLDIRGRPDLERPDWDAERAMIRQARDYARRRRLPIASVNDHGLLLKLAAHNDRFCMRLDDYIYIDVHGNVAPCCLLRSHGVGNVHDTSIHALWDSPQLKNFYGPSLPEECSGCDSFLNGYSSADSKEALSV